MYFQRRGEKFTFVYYDQDERKNRRLARALTPFIKTDAEALLFCEKWNQKYKSLSAATEERLSWQKDFPEFVDHLALFEKARVEDAPYSFQNQADYLRYHVFPYFLTLRRERDLSRWSKHFEEFRDFLLIAPPLKKMKGEYALAYWTKNAVIKSLNSFLGICKRRNLIELLLTCRLFPRSKCNIANEENVLSAEDQIRIHEALNAVSEKASDLFYICLHTGLRMNEALGLSLDDFFEGFPDSESLGRSLRKYPLEAFGFISLESQPALHQKLRDESGGVPRKPLKAKRSISAANSRTIPIFDSLCFNLLVKRWNEQWKLRKTTHPFRQVKDCLLFDGLNRNSYSSALRAAQKGREIVFTPHDTRHTYSTWLAEMTAGDFELCRMILGHSDVSTTLGYVHMGARIHRSIRSSHQLERPMQQVTSKESLDKQAQVFELFTKQRIK